MPWGTSDSAIRAPIENAEIVVFSIDYRIVLRRPVNYPPDRRHRVASGSRRTRRAGIWAYPASASHRHGRGRTSGQARNARSVAGRSAPASVLPLAPAQMLARWDGPGSAFTVGGTVLVSFSSLYDGWHLAASKTASAARTRSCCLAHERPTGSNRIAGGYRVASERLEASLIDLPLRRWWLKPRGRLVR